MALVGAGLVLLAVLVAVLSAQGTGDRVRVEDLAGSPHVEGELPVAPTDGAPDPAADAPAPRADGAGFDGTPVEVGNPGTAQLVMFVASWCEACRQELPLVVSWLDAGGLPDGVEFVTVVTWLDDARPNWPPDAWLDEEGYTGQVLVDDADSSVAQAFGQPATPYWVAVDAEGRIQSRTAGMLSLEQLEQLAASVAAG